MKIIAGYAASVSAVLATTSAAQAAAGTTCLCRKADGKLFGETTLRHSRWACDYLLGYMKGEKKPSRSRPEAETCSGEEITQFKVWICLQNGCTYQYAKSVEEKNGGLEKIEPMVGKRTP